MHRNCPVRAGQIGRVGRAGRCLQMNLRDNTFQLARPHEERRAHSIVDCRLLSVCSLSWLLPGKRKLIKRFINFYIMSTHIIRHNVHWHWHPSQSVVSLFICASYPAVLYLSLAVVYFSGPTHTHIHTRTHTHARIRSHAGRWTVYLDAACFLPLSVNQLMTKSKTKVRWVYVCVCVLVA